MSELRRRPPTITVPEIEKAKGRRERVRDTKSLYLDEISFIYGKISAICPTVAVSTEIYDSMPIDKWKDVTDERFDWIEINGHNPDFRFRSEKSDGVTLSTSETSPETDALFEELLPYLRNRRIWFAFLNDIGSSTIPPLLLTALAGVALALPFSAYIFNLVADSQILTEQITATPTLTGESSDSPASKNEDRRNETLSDRFLVTLAGIMAIISVAIVGGGTWFSKVHPRRVGNVIWYYRRDLPKTRTDKAMIVATIVSALLSAIITAGVTWTVAKSQQ
jgi:nitrate reductase NapE component